MSTALPEAPVGNGKPHHWPRYPSYKPSGVEWLGDVPEGWGSKKIKYVSKINSNSLGENTPLDYELKYVDISSVDPVKGIIQTEDFTFEKAPSRARRMVQNGDVIVSTVRTYLKAIAPIINPEPNLIVSTGFAVIRPQKKLNSHYAAFAFTATYFVEKVVANSTGVSYPAINASEIGNMKIIMPPLPEQSAIATFLDRETALIDALIERKERQIELLQEKRAALISHAVTKGLDPSVPMKDSGIEWLGMVPGHWEICAVKRNYEIQLGKMLQNAPESDDDVHVPYLRAIHVQWGKVDSTDPPEMWASPYEISQYGITSGDLLVCEGGEGGRSCVVDSIPNNCIIQNALHRVRPKKNANLVFLEYIMYNVSSSGWFDVICNKATITHFTQEKFNELKIALPPNNEQKNIADFLDHETTKIDNLIHLINDSMEKLHEYRSALISAAVTGKIDVRQEAKA